MTGILREELKFQGLIISDSMAMGAIADKYPRKEAWIRAVLAGVDMILDTSSDDIEKHYEAFVAAVKLHPELRTRVDQACLNIVAHKIEYGVIPDESVVPPVSLPKFNKDNAEKEASYVADHSIALREGTGHSLEAALKAMECMPGGECKNPLHMAYTPQAEDAFNMLREKRKPADATAISGAMSPCGAYWLEIEKLDKGLVMVVLKHYDTFGARIETKPSTAIIAFIWKVYMRMATVPGLHLIVVSMMNPFYDLRALPLDLPVLVAGDDTKLTVEAIQNVISGRGGAHGKVPFDLGSFSPVMPPEAAC